MSRRRRLELVNLTDRTILVPDVALLEGAELARFRRLVAAQLAADAERTRRKA